MLSIIVVKGEHVDWNPRRHTTPPPFPADGIENWTSKVSCFLLNVSWRISGFALLLVSHKLRVLFLRALEWAMDMYMYQNNLFGRPASFAFQPAGFRLISVTGFSGGLREYWVQVYLSELRGPCCGNSKWPELVSNHGIACRRARANQLHANPNTKLDFRHTNFSLFLVFYNT